MADFTLARPDIFPEGTSVALYLRRAIPPGHTGPPLATPLDTQTMTNGEVVFEDLDPGEYVAGASVSGAYRYSGFNIDEPGPQDIPGPQGESAYDAAGGDAIWGNVEDWLASLQGPPGNTELGYSEITSNFATTTTSSHVDVTNLSVTVTVGDRPIVIKVFAPSLTHSVASASYIAFIREGTTDLAYAQRSANAALELTELNLSRRLAPSAGEHTYKVTTYTTVAGTVTMQAAAGGPAFIQVVEV